MIRVIALLVMLAAPAEADRLSLLLGSHHVDLPGGEEINPGVFYTFERDPLDWTVGVYRNSFGRGSVAATASRSVVRWNGGEAAIFAGAGWYPRDGRHLPGSVGDIIPLGGLQLRHGHAFTQIMPIGGGHTLVTFGLTFDLERTNQ